MKRLGRREAVRALLLAVPMAVVARKAIPFDVAAGPRGPSPRPAPVPGPGQPASDPVARPFAELAPGMPVGRCTLVSIEPVVSGGVPVRLRAPDGVEFQVDVLRHDPETPGVARARSLAVYVKNGGTGAKATDEVHGLGAMALARLLARREAGGAEVPALLTLRERAPLLAARGERS